MISKKIKVTLLAALLMVTGIAQTTLADITTKKDSNIKTEAKIENSEEYVATVCDCDFEEMTFENLVEGMKEDINKEDLTKLEKIYNEVKVLEETEKFEEANKKWNEFYNIYDKYIPEMTFEDLVGDMKENIKKEDLVKLEKAFNEAMALDKEEKFEAAEKKWDEFYNIYDKYILEMGALENIYFEEMTFENLVEGMKEDINKEDLVKLEKVFNEAMALDKEEKFEAAEKKWDEFYNIYDKYIPEMTFEDLVGDMKEHVKKEELVKLEKIFNNGMALEKQDKYEEADKEWNKFYEILSQIDLSEK